VWVETLPYFSRISMGGTWREKQEVVILDNSQRKSVLRIVRSWHKQKTLHRTDEISTLQ
jgi:hypothetical protein